MTITAQHFGDDLEEGVSSWFGLKYNEHKEEHSVIFTKHKSNRMYERDRGVTSFGMAPVKAHNTAIQYRDIQQGFQNEYFNATYGLGFMISKELYDDGVAVTESLRGAQALAFSIRTTQETAAALVLLRATNSSYLYGDGKTLIATDHPHFGAGSGTYSNRIATAADISESALEQLCIDISNATDDSGSPIAFRPMMLVGGTAIQFEMSRLLDNANRPNTANRDINALKESGAFPDGYFISHYMPGSTAWFIKTDCPDGLKHFERKSIEFANESAFDFDNAKFKATFRGSWGCSDPLGIFGSPGAN